MLQFISEGMLYKKCIFLSYKEEFGIYKTNFISWLCLAETMELTWNGKWISFMDTMLQASIVNDKGSGLRLPTRIRQVKVDPKSQPALPTDRESTSMSKSFFN